MKFRLLSLVSNSFCSNGACEFLLILLNMLNSIIFIFIFTAGCHRFVLGNFTDDSIDELKAHEVQEFDAPPEVG